MYKLLSYPLTGNVPVWPGNPQIRREPCSQTTRGDTANTFSITLFNHTGTHFDAPNHFIPGGPQISQLPLDRFIYGHPLLLDTPKKSREKISAADLLPHEPAISRCDLLLLRTGFSQYRTTDPGHYGAEGPGIGSDCAEYLVSRFKNLSAVAVDFVSISSYQDRPDGYRTHQILLGGREGHFICAIEDVNMDALIPGKIKKIFALPLMIEGIDSAPVSILAEITE